MAAVRYKEPPRAITEDGELVPGARLWFTTTGTDNDAPVYADPGRTIRRENPLRSDSAGRFGYFWLDPAVTYRARLLDDDDAVLWEVDPVGGEAVYPFTDPVAPLDDSGAAMPLARLTFWNARTTAEQTVYSDVDMLVPLDQPVVADESGEFEPIYLDDELAVRVRLEKSDGVLVYDLDNVTHLADPPDPVVGVIVLSTSGTIYKTRDGDEWVAQSVVGGGVQVKAAAFGGTRWVLGTRTGSSPFEYYSDDDAETWNAAAVSALFCNSLAYGNVTVGYAGVGTNSGGTRDHTYSVDGSTWSTPAGTLSATWDDILWVGDKFVACGNGISSNPRLMTSPEGATWTNRATTNDNYYHLAFAPTMGASGRILAVGNTTTPTAILQYSDNGGTAWTRVAPTGITATALLSAAWSPTLAMFVGSATIGGVRVPVTSTDGLAWTQRTGPDFWRIRWSAGLGAFFAVGTTAVYKSLDGINWSTLTLPGAPTNLQRLATR